MHSSVPRPAADAVTTDPAEATAPDAPEASTHSDEPAPEVAVELPPALPDEAPRRVVVQRTLWVRGRHPGRLVLRATTLLLLLGAAGSLLLTGRLGWGFDLLFVAACATMALWVRPKDFFMVGVYPPLALAVAVVVLGVADPGSVARPTDAPAQAVVSGLAHHAEALVVGYALTLGLIALRQVAIRNHGRLRLR